MTPVLSETGVERCQALVGHLRQRKGDWFLSRDMIGDAQHVLQSCFGTSLYKNFQAEVAIKTFSDVPVFGAKI